MSNQTIEEAKAKFNALSNEDKRIFVALVQIFNKIRWVEKDSATDELIEEADLLLNQTTHRQFLVNCWHLHYYESVNFFDL